MTTETKAREDWKAALQMFGKGSKEELDAYNQMIKIKSGEGRKRKERRPQTIKKAAQIVTLSLF